MTRIEDESVYVSLTLGELEFLRATLDELRVRAHKWSWYENEITAFSILAKFEAAISNLHHHIVTPRRWRRWKDPVNGEMLLGLPLPRNESPGDTLG